MNTKKRTFFLIALFVAAVCFTAFPNGETGLMAAGDDSNTEDAVVRFMKERTAALREMSKLSISASAGFSGHESGESNLYQLGLGISVSKEMYPGEFKFRTNTSLVIQDSKLQENVTLLNLSYEHYLTPWLETYGFLERFANTFLGLQYRYETGGGFKAEFNVQPGKWDSSKDKSARIRAEYNRLITALGRLAGDTDTLLEQLLNLKKEDTGIMEAARKDRSLLTLGMAVSLLAELEKPENAVLINAAGNLGQQEKFRIAFRPSFKFRPSNLIELSGQFYYKLPLFKRDNPDDPLQYRTFTILRAGLNLTGGAAWTKNAALVFEYQRHFDNNPFGAFNAINESNVNASVINKSHDIFLIQLNVEF